MSKLGRDLKVIPPGGRQQRYTGVSKVVGVQVAETRGLGGFAERPTSPVAVVGFLPRQAIWRHRLNGVCGRPLARIRPGSSASTSYPDHHPNSRRAGVRLNRLRSRSHRNRDSPHLAVPPHQAG